MLRDQQNCDVPNVAQYKKKDEKPLDNLPIFHVNMKHESFLNSSTIVSVYTFLSVLTVTVPKLLRQRISKVVESLILVVFFGQKVFVDEHHLVARSEIVAIEFCIQNTTIKQNFLSY